MGVIWGYAGHREKFGSWDLGLVVGLEGGVWGNSSKPGVLINSDLVRQWLLHINRICTKAHISSFMCIFLQYY